MIRAAGRRWIGRLACFFAATLSSAAWQTPMPMMGAGRPVFVEPFTTGDGSAKLRDDVIGELRKLGSVSVASTAASAGLILGGGGEIWVRGYRSLNPRSGTSPSNGTPIYGGYLAVELRDQEGGTIWSYLATPNSAFGDVSKNLAKQIAKHVAEALQHDAAQPSPVPSTQAGTNVPGNSPPSVAVRALKGAGATFPSPLYGKLITNYRRANPNLEITYDATGSEAGIRKLLSGDVDFAGSDSPAAIGQLAPGDEGKYLFFPAAVGAVVPIVNLPGVAGQIAFTPEILAGIYLGRIRKWNDPALAKVNPQVRLPDLDITVMHRSDGSGTSYVWTDYLSATSAEWKAKIGASLNPAWPVGRAANGNEGAAEMVKEIGGSIGYVEFIYALKNHLSFGKVRNQNGEFVAASLGSIGIAAGKAAAMGEDLKVSIVNAPGAGAYPIASFTWLVVPSRDLDGGRREALTGFLKWMTGPGQLQAAALGYLALPRDVVSREEAQLLRTR